MSLCLCIEFRRNSKSKIYSDSFNFSSKSFWHTSQICNPSRKSAIKNLKSDLPFGTVCANSLGSLVTPCFIFRWFKRLEYALNFRKQILHCFSSIVPSWHVFIWIWRKWLAWKFLQHILQQCLLVVKSDFGLLSITVFLLSTSESEKTKQSLLKQMVLKVSFITRWPSIPALITLLTANIFESGPMPTTWKFLARPPILPSCKLG